MNAGKVIQSPIEARPMYAKSGTPPDGTDPLVSILMKMPHRFISVGGRETSRPYEAATTEEIRESEFRAGLAELPLLNPSENLVGRDFFCSRELYSGEYRNFVLDAPDVISKYKTAFGHQLIYKVEWV
mgnify:CR=1 FL=1